MVALALALSVYALFWIVGMAILSALAVRQNRLQAMLLAPSVGLAVIVVLLLSLGRTGLAVESFGRILTVTLILASATILWFTRPILAWRRYGPVVVILLATLLAVGWPALQYDFDWVSYANDDMATEVLISSNLLKNGFPGPPDALALLEGRDYTQVAWFAHHVANERPGARLLLSWLSATTGRSGHEIYMPLIIALHLGLASAAGALVAHSNRNQLAVLFSTLLVGFSALAASSTMNQLIGQTGGLMLMAATATALIRPFPRGTGKTVKYAALVALLGSGFLIWYPEGVAFLGVAFGLFTAVGLVRRRVRFRPLVTMVGVAGLLAVLLVNTYLLIPIRFMYSQATGGQAFAVSSEGVRIATVLQSIFPTYLMPSGLANLWGLQPMGILPMEPWLSLNILIGAILLITLIVTAILLAWRRQPAAIMVSTIGLVALPLLYQGSGFGLYKIAMFLQPFMFPTLVVGWLGFVRARIQRRVWAWSVVPPVLLLLAGMPGQLSYVSASQNHSTATHLPGGSGSQIVGEFRRIMATLPPGPLVLDSLNIVLAKFQAVYTVGRKTQFPSTTFFHIRTRDLCAFEDIVLPALREEAREARDTYCRQMVWERGDQAHFDLLSNGEEPRVNGFFAETVGRANPEDDCPVLVAASGRQSVFNRRNSGENGENFVVAPCGDTTPRLIYVTSDLGRPYYGADPRDVNIFQLEREQFMRDGTMAGIGRHLLFQLVGTEAPVRFAMEVTSTYKSDGQNELPHAALIGAQREPFPLIGRGSARVFSSSLAPQMIEGDAYMAIDSGVEGQNFPYPRTGLMRLWGTDLPVDPRRVVVFARDISVISEARYQGLKPPSLLSNIRSDLTNPNLEYSGVYEDGWISESAFFILARPDGRASVIVRGSIPSIDDPEFRTDLTILVDGTEVAHQTLGPGPFELTAPVPEGGSRRRVDVRFSQFQHLPGEDQRPVGAFMESIGLTAAVGAPPTSVTARAGELQKPEVMASGLSQDGWTSDRSFLSLTQSGPSADVVVRGQVPQVGDAAFSTDLTLIVDGRETGRMTLGPGDFELRAPAPAGEAGERRIELRFTKTQQLPTPDGRQVGALIQSIGFEAAGSAAPAARTAPAAAPVPVLAQAPVATAGPTPSGPVPLQAITDPHTDLGNPTLQATGLDGDGWLAGSSSFTLAQPGPNASLVVRGMIPLVDDPGFASELRVIVDGEEVTRATFGLGDFQVRTTIPASETAQRRVELRFAATQQLPAPDSRQVGARVQFVGFEMGATASQTPAAQPAATPVPTAAGPTALQAITDPHTDLGNPVLQATGLDGDGWVAGTSSFTLAQPGPNAGLVVRGMIPLVDDPAFSSDVQILVDGQEVTRATFGLGDFSIKTTIPAGATAQRRVELRFSATQRLPAPDSRQVGARISFAGFEGN